MTSGPTAFTKQSRDRRCATISNVRWISGLELLRRSALCTILSAQLLHPAAITTAIGIKSWSLGVVP